VPPVKVRGGPAAGAPLRDLEPLLRLGFRPFPCVAGGKRPRDVGYQTENYSLASLDAWRQGGGNLGLLVPEGYVVLDVDVRHAPAGWDLGDCLSTIERELGVDPRKHLHQLTGGGGLHLPVEVEDCRPRKPRGAPWEGPSGRWLDLKWAGGFIMAPGSKHPSGGSYLLRPGPVAESTPALLEVVTRPAQEGGDEGPIPFERARPLLDQLDPTDFRDYDDWSELLRSFVAATGKSPEGRAAFLAWCARDPLYAGQSESVAYHWDSYDPKGGTGPATLVHLVQERGGDPVRSERDIEAWRHQAVMEAAAAVEPEEVVPKPKNRFERGEVYSEATLDLERPMPVLDGLVSEKGVLTLFAPGGYGKTHVAISLSLAVARGDEQWMGRRLWLSGPAVYIAGEGDWNVVSRLKAWSQHTGGRLGEFVFQPEPFRFDRNADRAELREWLTAKKPAMIVFDTLNSMKGALDINSDQDMDAWVVSYLRKLARDLDALVLLVHHTPKADQTTAKGSSSLEDNVNGAMYLARNTENSGISLKSKKLRSGQPRSLALGFEEVNLGAHPLTGEDVKESVLVEGKEFRSSLAVEVAAMFDVPGASVPYDEIVALVQARRDVKRDSAQQWVRRNLTEANGFKRVGESIVLQGGAQEEGPDG